MRGYQPRQAHRLALERRKAKVRPRFSGSIWRKVDLLIQRDWSPEQISGRVKAEASIRISHEYICQYIYADKRAGGQLYRHLRLKNKEAEALRILRSSWCDQKPGVDRRTAGGGR